MTLRIVTDSTCDLPQSLIERYQITVVPLYIHIGNESYRDQIDLTREQFYQGLPDYPAPPMTAVPAPEVFERAYRGLIAEGATEILSIHISASLSTIRDQAHNAARAISELAFVLSSLFARGPGPSARSLDPDATPSRPFRPHVKDPNAACGDHLPL